MILSTWDMMAYMEESGTGRMDMPAHHVVARVRRRGLSDDDYVVARVASGPAERLDSLRVSDREDDLAGCYGASTVIGEGGSYGVG